MMTTGDMIRRLRIAKGLSQKELADICGVSMGAVSAWEQGRNEPRPKILNKIAAYFHIPIADIQDDLAVAGNPTASDHYYTSEEVRLIQKYRSLSLLGKKIVNAVIDVQIEDMRQHSMETAKAPTKEMADLLEQLAGANPSMIKELERYYQFLKDR